MKMCIITDSILTNSLNTDQNRSPASCLSGESSPVSDKQMEGPPALHALRSGPSIGCMVKKVDKRKPPSVHIR